MNTYKFASLISPYTVEDFFANYYEKTYLYLKRDRPDYYKGILNTDDIDLFFQNKSLLASSLRVCKEGNEVPAYKWNRGKSNLADNDKLFKFFNDGNTIIINTGNNSITKLTNYCQDLERELQFHLQFNIYITPVSAKGFANHYDDHDVIILQTTGTKIWRLYSIPFELPCSKQSHHQFMKDKYELGEPTFEQELEPGDLLYIPRGLVHDAITTDSASVHITLGLHPTYRFDLLQEMVSLAQDELEFRKAVPSRMFESDRTGFASDFKQLCHSFIDNLDIDSLLETKFENFLTSRVSEDKNRFLDSIQAHKLNLNYILSRRENVIYKIERDKEKIYIKFYNKKLEFPLFTELSLQTFWQEKSFCIKDIGGLISDSGKIELASKFVREGFLRIENIGE